MTSQRAVFLSVFFALCAPAQAMTFATGAGADNAGCGAVTAPCRTLHQAITNTPAGGYVVLQGPADFGPAAAIDKSISIVGEGGATIRANSADDGIQIINASNLIVRLRGLTIENAGFGATGIMFTGAARLEITNCVIRNFRSEGIFAVAYSAGPTHRSFVSVVDTLIENAASVGFVARKSYGVDASVSSYLDGVRARGGQFGFALAYEGGDAARAVIVNSAATDNSSGGFLGTQRGFPSPQLTPDTGLFVVRSVASGSAAGVISGTFNDADGLVTLSNSVVTGNASANGGTKLAHSYGNNVIRGNTDDTLAKFSPAALH